MPRMDNRMFTGLSAFPLTPMDSDGIVDTDALAVLVGRLATAGVDSIGLLGSTGGYAYLDRAERARAVAAAVEAAAGRVAVIVGVGSMRTRWSQHLAADAERAGADGLLMAPMSYLPLTSDEVAQHYRAVAGTTGLSLCIYNNPGTTNFVFSDALIAQLAAIPTIAAIKMPAPQNRDYSTELAVLRATSPDNFRIGYSGDWIAAQALLAGADAWYSVIGGLLPEHALRLTRAAQGGRQTEAEALDQAFSPLWALFRTYGSARLMYVIADRLGLRVGDPPLPIRRVDDGVAGQVELALDRLMTIEYTTAHQG